MIRVNARYATAENLQDAGLRVRTVIGSDSVMGPMVRMVVRNNQADIPMVLSYLRRRVSFRELVTIHFMDADGAFAGKAHMRLDNCADCGTPCDGFHLLLSPELAGHAA